MESTDLPVMFIKKPNGGVHTARNAGVLKARGDMTLCIDSDDELKPNACEVFYETWLAFRERERERGLAN